MGALVVGPPADTDVAFVLGVLHRVEHQVGESAAQLRLTAFEAKARRGLQSDALVARPGQRLGVVHDRTKQGVDCHRLVVRRVIGGFQLGQQQQVVEQRLHT
ncbi:hypothetical protein D3C81_1993500 [compost metagenome]